MCSGLAARHPHHRSLGRDPSKLVGVLARMCHPRSRDDRRPRDVRRDARRLSTGCLRGVRWPFAEPSPVVCWLFAGLFASCGPARWSLPLRGTAAVFARGPLGPTPWRTHACCGKVIAAVPFVRFCGSPSGGSDLSGGSDPSDSGSPSASHDCRPAGSPARRGRRNSSSWKGIQGGEARRDPCAGSA